MLERALITHASPTLAGLKAGSLFSVPCGGAALTAEVRRLNAMLLPRGLRLMTLRRDAHRALLYLCRDQALRETLRRPDVQALLRRCGYSAFTPGAAIRTLRARLASSGGFPHEIGIFLGYPLADVIGFIRNGGRNCLCSGCWKAYANAPEALRTFARIRKCRAVYARRFAEGCPLSRLAVRTTAP